MESFLIAEKYVPKNELLKVAKAVLLAQDIKEDSWDGKYYSKTDGIAANEAVSSAGISKIWIEIIHGWNVHMWNDCQGWAQEIINTHKETDR